MEVETTSAETPPPTTTTEGDDLLLSLLGITSRAPPHAFGYLTARDRAQLLLVNKHVNHNLQQVEYTRCKDGRLYKVPFPGFPGLLETHDDDGLFPHQLASFQAMHEAENASTEFGALRGGILGDAPGLGKTITMLALVASTAGIRPKAPPEPWTDQERQEGWESFAQNPGCDRDVTRAIRPFLGLPTYSQLHRDTKPPFSLTKFPTIQRFARHVRRAARAGGATEPQLDRFRQNLIELQAGLHKSHRKVLMSAAGKRRAWERRLVPTSATLLVVPDALLEHWFVQVHTHLNRGLFSADAKGRGVVYLDGVGDIADARTPLVEAAVAGHKLPQPWDLAKYTIVVTTFSRCEQEYQFEVGVGNIQGGKIVKATKTNGNNNKKKRRHSQAQSTEDDVTVANNFCSSLLNMRWLRVVVDEGHELGTHEGGNGVTRFVHQMAAERRWVLSGTPTTGDEDEVDFSSKALDQLQRLLLFLRHPVYGSLPSASIAGTTTNRRQNRPNQKQQAREAWKERVKDPFLQKQPPGREELVRILKSVAVLHRKEDIRLPKPIFRNIEVDVPLPEDVQTNLQEHPNSSATLLNAYLRTDAFQELVDKAQGGYILKAIQKAKDQLQQRGGPLQISSHRMRMVSEEDIANTKDRRPIKAVVYSSSKFNLRDVTEALYSKLTFENIAEAYDDPRWDTGSELSRFRHNQKEVRKCPICGYQNECKGAARELRQLPKCENYLMEVVLREDEDVRFLIETERVVRAVPVGEGGNTLTGRLGGLPYEKYGTNRRIWREGDILEVNIMDPHPWLQKRESVEHWEEWGMEKCIEKAQNDLYVGRDWFFGPLPTVEEGERTTQVILKKWQGCGRFHNRLQGSGNGWYQGPVLSDVPVEAIHENTFILSLDAGLAHGLDLSFVTHIFLLEPVDDAALLEQITSRAHRLGATGPVTIETVNPYYKLDPATEAAVEASLAFEQQSKRDKKKKEDSSSAMAIENRKKTALTKVVCQYCYRQFDSMEKAVAHENNQCARNPENADVVDPWHVSSVYREIRPPPPYTTTTQRA